MEIEQLTENQIIHEIRLLYRQRKKENGDTLEVLANEIGISPATLHNSIKAKFTSRKSLLLYRKYLQKIKQAVS